jgi:hypothetical protein
VTRKLSCLCAFSRAPLHLTNATDKPANVCSNTCPMSWRPLREIHTSGIWLLKLINQLFDISKKEGTPLIGPNVNILVSHRRFIKTYGRCCCFSYLDVPKDFVPEFRGCTKLERHWNASSWTRLNLQRKVLWNSKVITHQGIVWQHGIYCPRDCISGERLRRILTCLNTDNSRHSLDWLTFKEIESAE